MILLNAEEYVQPQQTNKINDTKLTKKRDEQTKQSTDSNTNENRQIDITVILSWRRILNLNFKHQLPNLFGFLINKRKPWIGFHNRFI